MKFGIFDHVDDSGLPLADHLEARLAMVEAYEAAGFHCYHVAEHHGTPLGHAPSPGMLFAALSQRTSRILFGPLVYLLPLYHPLRLIEEIAMLDNLSGGRMQLGFGRGISPIEMGFYGVDMAEQRERFAETREVVMLGLTQDRLTYNGRFYRFDNVPIRQRPVQRPHPPLWQGSNSPESAGQCARDGVNMVTLMAGARMAALVAHYRAEYAAGGGDPAAMPLVGAGRHIVVADSDEQALDIARPAYAQWAASFVRLWEESGAHNPMLAHFPRTWDAVEAAGTACAGSPERVRAFIEADHAEGGYSYFVAQLAFGGLTLDQVRRSAALFGAEVMPAFVAESGAA